MCASRSPPQCASAVLVQLKRLWHVWPDRVRFAANSDIWCRRAAAKKKRPSINSLGSGKIGAMTTKRDLIHFMLADLALAPTDQLRGQRPTSVRGSPDASDGTSPKPSVFSSAPPNAWWCCAYASRDPHSTPSVSVACANSFQK